MKAERKNKFQFSPADRWEAFTSLPLYARGDALAVRRWHPSPEHAAHRQQKEREGRPGTQRCPPPCHQMRVEGALGLAAPPYKRQPWRAGPFPAFRARAAPYHPYAPVAASPARPHQATTRLPRSPAGPPAAAPEGHTAAAATTVHSASAARPMPLPALPAAGGRWLPKQRWRRPPAP